MEFSELVDEIESFCDKKPRLAMDLRRFFEQHPQMRLAIKHLRRDDRIVSTGLNAGTTYYTPGLWKRLYGVEPLKNAQASLTKGGQPVPQRFFGAAELPRPRPGRVKTVIRGGVKVTIAEHGGGRYEPDIKPGEGYFSRLHTVTKNSAASL